ncbi:hypothetical protein [Mesorhizobium sp. CN2-181]|uniref:hypothetical protein n=1 Tax=Mesorhizobium yinganensis TaxID=3157707 RepID=UPI0032B82D54
MLVATPLQGRSYAQAGISPELLQSHPLMMELITLYTYIGAAQECSRNELAFSPDNVATLLRAFGSSTVDIPDRIKNQAWTVAKKLTAENPPIASFEACTALKLSLSYGDPELFENDRQLELGPLEKAPF